jgi:predicted dehydrogenase
MRVLFIGLGSVGNRHLRNINFLTDGDTEFIAYRRVNSLSSSSANGINSDIDISDDNNKSSVKVRQVATIADALSERPTFAVVSSPTSLHVEDGLPVLQANVPLFLEKPVSNSFNSALELAKVAKRQKSIVFIGLQLRFHPLLQRLRHLVQEKVLGKILFVEAAVGSFLPDWHPNEDYHASYCARRELGGGAVLTLIHEIDYLYWIFGLPVNVVAFQSHDPRLNINVDSCVSTLMTFKREQYSFPAYLNQNLSERPVRRYCRVSGSNGTAELDLTSNELVHVDNKGSLIETFSNPELCRNDLFLYEMKSFIQCIEGVEEPSIPLHDALPSQLIAESIKQSLISGEVARVKPNILDLSL